MVADLPEGFTVVERTEIGDLSDVKEEGRPLIPPTKNVKVQIKRVSVRANKDGSANPAGSYRWFNLGLQVVDGVDINGELRYKGAYLNTDNMCYYADKQYYPKSAGEQKGLFFGKLADLQRATNTVGMAIDDDFIEAITDKLVLCNIEQTKGRDDNKVNVARFLKALPVSQQV